MRGWEPTTTDAEGGRAPRPDGGTEAPRPRPGERAVRVALADDQALFRDLLCQSLARAGGFEVVGVASNAAEALRAVVDHAPDVLLLDIRMPGLDSFEAARTMKSRAPGTAVIFLSGYSNDLYIEQALRVGGRGFLTKGEPLERMLEAIQEVAAGGNCYSQEIVERMVCEGDGVVRLAEDARTLSSRLTPRELEVLTYIARGHSKKEIAVVMHVAQKTVENHTTNLMSKLDIHDRVALTRYAIREGLVGA